MKHRDDMTFFERAALSFLLLAAFCASCLGAQTLVQRVPPPASAVKMWQHDLACSGIRPAPGLGLDAVVWVVGVWGPNLDDSSVTMGEWLPPDTIALLPITYQSPIIVAHELMHHLLQGPDGEAQHPRAFYDCDLMPEQHPVDEIAQLIDLVPKPFKRPPPAYGREERVAGRDYCVEIFHCPGFAHWWRPSDSQFGPVWWFISEAGSGCPVAPSDFTIVQDHQPFFCAWRSPRP